MINKLTSLYENFLNALSHIEGVGPLLIRIYLAPIFIIAGWHKLDNFESTAAWFGNPEWGLGLPMPELLAALAGGTELVGGLLLIPGLAVRLIAIPLAFTMVVAAVTAHWQFGWHALPEATLTMPWEWRMDLIEEASTRKSAAVSILKEHGNYGWLSEAGSFTILKNGIEFAATYFIMLIVLVFTGGGRYTSADFWIRSNIQKSNA